MTFQNNVHEAKWTFLSNHAHVLLCLAQSPSLRMRDMAEKVGITERAIQRIIAELAEEGYIDVIRDGRCNSYVIHKEKHLKHLLEAHASIADLVNMLDKSVDNTHQREILHV